MPVESQAGRKGLIANAHVYEFAQTEDQHLVVITRDMQIHSQQKLHYLLTYPAVLRMIYPCRCS
jgi:hypothetical protein